MSLHVSICLCNSYVKYTYVTLYADMCFYSGKLLEDVRCHQRVEIVKTKRRFHRLIADPTFQSGQILSPHLFVCKRGKSSVTLNRPIFVGKYLSIYLSVSSSVFSFLMLNFFYASCINPIFYFDSFCAEGKA